MTGAQCDTCREFASGQYPPQGWIVLISYSGQVNFLGQEQTEIEGTFCSKTCAANWLYAKIAIPEGGT